MHNVDSKLNSTFWYISGKIFVPEYLGPRCHHPWWIELVWGPPADAKGRACALGTACHSAQSAARTNRTRSRPVVQTIILNKHANSLSHFITIFLYRGTVGVFAQYVQRERTSLQKAENQDITLSMLFVYICLLMEVRGGGGVCHCVFYWDRGSNFRRRFS